MTKKELIQLDFLIDKLDNQQHLEEFTLTDLKYAILNALDVVED